MLLNGRFKPLTLADRSNYEAVVSRFPTHSDFDFTSIFSWDGSARYAIVPGGVAIDLATYHGPGRVVSFVADRDVSETTRRLLDYAEAQGSDDGLSLIAEWMIPHFESDDGLWELEDDEANADYLIRLTDPTSRLFSGRRHAASMRFEARCDPRFIQMNIDGPEDQARILLLFDKWRMIGNRDLEATDDELQALRRLLTHSSDLDAEAFGVTIGAHLVAFEIAEVKECAGTPTCISHFAKALTAHSGVTEYLFRRVAETLIDRGVELWNWEQDLGLPGLRQHKASYASEQLRKFTVRAPA